MASDVMCISKLLISKLQVDRQTAKHPARISKNPHAALKTNLSGLKLSRGFTCAAGYAINSLKETLSISNCPASFGLRLDQA